MSSLNLLRILFLFCGCGLVTVELLFSRRIKLFRNFSFSLLYFWGGINILFIIFLWFNHINFPLFVDLMEGVVFQHFQHAVAFQPIYPAATPEYVPLAYNPLFYVISLPFGWIFGVQLSTLRLVAILGMLGCAAVSFLMIRRETGSARWAFLTVGVFAAAYSVMDAYLDSAHSDSWLLFTALLGTYLISLNRSRKLDLLGLLVLIASFWFKQHGALFVVGGVLFLTWRHGIKKSIVYWVVAVLFGPVLYLFGGPALFGSNFLQFTWEIPRNWSELNWQTFLRILVFILKSYPVLALASGILVVWMGLRNRSQFNVWHLQYFFACFSGMMGSLDAGSSNNVFVSMGMWFILLGMLGLFELKKRFPALTVKYAILQYSLVITLAFLLYNPLSMITSPRAHESYQDLIAFINSLDGTVYAPTLGQLPKDFVFYPAAHWVALEDMIRGPGRDTRNHPNTRLLLEPTLNPQGSAYILANYPLEVYPWLDFLNDYYVLEQDLEGRFEPLRVLPKRWDHGWPRYLYRYEPNISNENR